MDDLPRGKFGAILVDPPWHFKVWSFSDKSIAKQHYNTMDIEDIYRLSVKDVAAKDCVLFIWVIWPMLEHGLKAIETWGFKYKTCAFAWMKTRANGNLAMGTGYWTRANTETCLLATKGHPKRINTDVMQAILDERREHSRKPDCIHERIERLVAGPYLELFARQTRPGWISWGNEVNKFDQGQQCLSLSRAYPSP